MAWSRRLSAVAVLVAALLIPIGAAAQEPPDPSADAQFRFGPIRFTPSVNLRAGVDTNVFNQAENPRRDFAIELTPNIDSWLRLGRARLSGVTTVGFIYFQKFDSERSINPRQELRFEVPLNRIRFYASGTALSSRERPNIEVDLRARRLETLVATGVDVNPTPKTTIGIAAQRVRVDFGSNQEFLDVELRDVLNRSIESVTGSMRRVLTPYTTLVFLATAERERFPFTPVRDSNSVRLLPGVEFHRFALLAGRVFVGHRRFEPQSDRLPEFSGVVASADLGYTLRGVTRFGIVAERDLVYSVENVQPYFVQTGLTGTVLHNVGERWQVGGRLGRYLLKYQASLIPEPILDQPTNVIDQPANRPVAPRADSVLQAGAELRYRLGPDTLIGLGVRQLRRRSAADGREFNGLRVGVDFIYKDQP